MEEVWDDINLASLNDKPPDFRGMILQDFLARPCSNKDSVAAAIVTSGFASPAPPPPPPPPPPTTMLTLNSIPERFHFLGNSDPLNQTSHSQPQTVSSSCCVTVASYHGKKRLTEPDSDFAGDRRHKRMIKNRESAARSRARKQESLFFILLFICLFTNISGSY
ncbi:FD isoform X2 [Olea europaea subsp. europaea]|uniref:FD isoform X2 n=1 Tax=Olea europaea subsp. europaea TaxID=158383 RepID=A0A8S0RAA8_OLEEU|nr:FD isoform X2 [Olea europaea subsp. europaea]